MKIAITGSSGTVGKETVKLCANAGHHTVQVDLTEDGAIKDIQNTEVKVVDIAGDYKGVLEAFKGCDAVIHLAAIPNPVNKDDDKVHNNNVCGAFNGFRACGELGIKRIAYASSVNAIGLAYSNQHLTFDYFPIDEEHQHRPTDAYALAKSETELQARAFVNWFPGTKIACLRFHAVSPREVQTKEHAEYWEDSGVRQLWGWVHPVATARSCLLAVEKADRFEGCEVFNVHARTTAQETSSRELAQRYWPDVKIKGEWGKSNEAFWTTEKIERVLGWKHEETE